MSRKLAILFVAGLLFQLFAVSAFADSGPPTLRGRAVVLMDGLTGQILYQQNGAERNFPASTTKLLTAMVALEHGRLDQVIRVSRDAVAKGPDSASCYVSEGEEQPLEYLLYGLLLPSGNDCADAIAEGLAGGDRQRFVEWMNETAGRLGAENSHFSNPHGLHEEDHYTSALDLALIARAALADPVIRRISATKEFIWPGKDNGTYYNHNGLLWMRDDIIGGKTGYTEQAGFTLVTSAVRDGRQLIGVLMGYEDKGAEFADMDELLNWGFGRFVPVEAVKAGSAQGDVKVLEGTAPAVSAVAGESFTVSAPRGGAPTVTVVPRLESSLQAPVAQGDRVGLLEVRDGQRVIGTVPVVAGVGVQRIPPFRQAAVKWGLAALKWTGLILGGLFLFRTVVRTVRRAHRRMRRPGFGSRPRANGTHGQISSYRTRTPR